MKRISFYILTLLLFSVSCTKTKYRTLEEKVIYYENRAKSYEALANSQRMSSPYGNGENQVRSIFYDPPMRMIYLREAKKYRDLAKIAKLQSDQNK